MTDELKISTKGRITIPKSLRDEVGFAPGTRVEWFPRADGVEVRSVADEADAPRPN